MRGDKKVHEIFKLLPLFMLPDSENFDSDNNIFHIIYNNLLKKNKV